MAGAHRARRRVEYPDAPLGTCKHCGRSCSPRRRTHDECREDQFEVNEYREAAARREGGKQRCTDCGLVEGQTRKVPGDHPGGWVWERVRIERDHPQELIDNGPRDWTVPRCTRCHNEKTQRARAQRKGRPVKGGREGSWLLLLVGFGVLGLAAWTMSKPPKVDGPVNWDNAWERAAPLLALALVLAGVLVIVVGWWRWRARRRADTLLRLGDAIARETHTDPSRIQIRVRRWERGAPVKATCRYSSLFDDSEGSRGREKVEALVARKTGQPLDFTWRPHRDTLAWRPVAAERDVEPDEIPTDDTPLPVAPPTRAAVIERLTGGLVAALGAHADVEVLDWHARNVPARFLVTFPAAARVHEDKIQDAVEDKVSTLLPGTWRAEWRTITDQVEFTDRPDPLAGIVAAPPLPQKVDLAALPLGTRDDGHPWTVRLTQTHVLVAGASGAGKGSVLWSLIRALSPAVADGSVRLWAVDPKGGMELGRGRAAFERFATDVTDAQRLLDAAVAFMQKRAKRLAADGSRRHEPSPTDPLLVLVIDEIATLTKYGAITKASRDAVNASLGLLLSQGRAVGVCVVGALQDPRKDVLTMRDLFPTRIALRLNEPNAPDMVLGAGARAAGARADRIAVEHAGVGYMMVDGSPTPERFRAAWISDDDIDALVTLCLRSRTPRDYEEQRALLDSSLRDVAPLWTSVDLHDLNEGDRIMVEIDGVEHQVTVDARPCPSDPSESLYDVEWTDDNGRKGVHVYEDDATVRRLPPTATR